jgi:hypothetical protein
VHIFREISNKAVGPELKSKSEWFYASLPDRTYNGYVDEICSSHLLADCAGIDNRDAYPTVYLGRVCFFCHRDTWLSASSAPGWAALLCAISTSRSCLLFTHF